MTFDEEFEYFTDQLLENATSEFRKTEEYELLKEKVEQMNRDCEVMLTEDQRVFAEECFDLIMDADSRQENFTYRKGLNDCVFILKRLGVLA